MQRNRHAWLTAILLSTLASTAHAQPTAEAKAGARAAATQGVTAFDEKRYAEALDLFTRAESLMHAPTHVLMIARAQAALGRLVRARESYTALARETLVEGAPPAFKEAQADGSKELEALEPRVPTIDVKLSDPAAKNVTITMDGTALPAALVGIPHPVDPGKHVLTARGEDVMAEEKSVAVAEGAHVSVVLDLQPAPHQDRPLAPGAAPPNRALKIAGFTGIALGAVGIGVGATFIGLGFSKRGAANDAYAACGAAACVRGSAGADEVDALDRNASTKQTVGLVGLVAGGVFAAAGVTLVIVSGRGSSGETGLVVGPQSLSLAGTF